MMSWFTVGEIVIWLVAAAALGVVLGWLLHELWGRARARRAAPAAPAPVPVPAVEVTVEDPPPVESLRIKGNGTSMIYHTHDSPAYERTRADLWFDTEADAIAAGFRKPKNA